MSGWWILALGVGLVLVLFMVWAVWLSAGAIVDHWFPGPVQQNQMDADVSTECKPCGRENHTPAIPPHHR